MKIKGLKHITLTRLELIQAAAKYNIVRRRPVKAQRATGARKWEQILIDTALGFSRK